MRTTRPADPAATPAPQRSDGYDVLVANADRRLGMSSVGGRLLTAAALSVPIALLAIWEILSQADGRPLPGTVVASIALCLLPGVVYVLRARRHPHSSMLSSSTPMMITYWTVLGIGVPSTWYFSPSTSFFYAYDAALIYLATFMVVKCLVRVIGIYLMKTPEPAPLTHVSRVPMFVLMLPQLALFAIIAVRIQLGAFFHSAHGEFMHVSPYFGPLMMISQAFMLLIPVAGAEAFRRHADGVPNSGLWVSAYLAMGATHLIFATLQGGRTGILQYGLLYGIGLAFGVPRLRPRQLLGGFAVVAALSIFAGVFRGKLHDEAGRKQSADVADVRLAASSSMEELERTENPLKSTFQRFDDFRPLAAVHQYYGGRELGGETFEVILYDPVPRVFWPEKPKHSDLALITGAILQEGGSSPLTCPGEFFVNFGESGAIIGGIVAGLLWILVDLLFDRRRRDPLVLGFAATAWAALTMYIATLGGLVGAMYKTLIAAALVRWLVVFLYRDRGATVKGGSVQGPLARRISA